jgi:hypothetical protein
LKQQFLGVALARLNAPTPLHQALGYLTPREMFKAPVTRGYVNNASALTPSSPAHHQQQERDSIELEKAL